MTDVLHKLVDESFYQLLIRMESLLIITWKSILKAVNALHDFSKEYEIPKQTEN